MATEQARQVVIGVGELLWDCFPDSRRPGGAPANVAYHAGQLGLAGVVCSRVGEDVDGDELVRYLADRGLDTRCVQRDPQHPTGTVAVHLDRADTPSYTIHEGVAWDHLELEPTWEVAFRGAAAVCFGTLAQRHEVSRVTIGRALRLAGDALLVYDVNLRPPFYERGWVELSLRRADVFKLNDQEAPVLAELLRLKWTGLEPFAWTLLDRYQADVVCITRGARGCLVVSQDKSVDVPGYPAEVVDAVGAGDAFTAALTYGLLRRWPLEATAELANEVGALVATKPGAMPDVAAEYARLKATHRRAEAGDR